MAPKAKKDSGEPTKAALYTLKLTDTQAKKLGEIVRAKGWELFEVAHSLFGVSRKIARLRHAGYLDPERSALFGTFSTDSRLSVVMRTFAVMPGSSSPRSLLAETIAM
jgi:hypothetical protein